jgi:hypothetical protein
VSWTCSLFVGDTELTTTSVTIKVNPEYERQARLVVRFAVVLKVQDGARSITPEMSRAS